MPRQQQQQQQQCLSGRQTQPISSVGAAYLMMNVSRSINWAASTWKTSAIVGSNVWRRCGCSSSSIHGMAAVSMSVVG